MGGNRIDTQMFWDMLSTKQQQIASDQRSAAARKRQGQSFVSVVHHIDVEWMYCAYKLVRRDGAKGIDGVGAEEYEANLWENLQSLVDRLKSGTYRAPPVKRVYIPKAGSEERRPLGIPTYEDKILQRAVQLALEPIYEQNFYDFSYGFRLGKSAHQAVNRLWKESMNIKGGYIIDLDISKYFDTIPHDKLRDILGRQVSDGTLQQVIEQWLHAGVMEAGKVSYSETGSPQGGVISPLLSNIYLHEVLDDWFVKVVQPRLRGKSFMVRYADDAVIGCEKQEDADRIMKVLALRCAKYGLTIHPEKTRLVDFRKPTGENPTGNGSFTFLGFQHYWTKSRKGQWIVGQKTDTKRLSQTLQAITQWCRVNRHRAKNEQHKELSAKLRGHYGYYGIPLNYASIRIFYEQAKRIWHKWLNRGSTTTNQNWQQFSEYLRDFPLPNPKIMHFWS